MADIRGRGLLFGIQLTDGDHPAEDAAESILYACLKKGLSFKISGGNFLTLTPALTITDEEMDCALDILENAILTL